MAYSDRCVNKELRIYRSAQSFSSEAGRIRAAKVVNIIEKALPILHEVLQLDPEVKFRVSSIKGSRTKGRYSARGKMATICYRVNSFDSILQTVCHEMVHCEQYYTGRLQNIFDGRSWQYEWNGSTTNKGTTYKAYRAQPHEKEAFSKQELLAKAVLTIYGVSKAEELVDQ